MARDSAEEQETESNLCGYFEQASVVPEGDVTSLGSAIFAFMAAGTFSFHRKSTRCTVPEVHGIRTNAASAAVYDELFALYHKLYFSMGQRNAPATAIGDVTAGVAANRGECVGAQ